jgi:dipeptidase
LLAAVNGKHWMAKRVPDDRVALIANTYTIHDIVLADTMNCLGSTDVIDYAVERGWYDPEADGEFDFAKAYADSGVAADERNIGRQWDGIRLLAADPPEYGDPLPFAIVPRGKVDVGMIISALRSHYDDTELYYADSVGCPHGNEITPICRSNTQTSFVAQLRSDMPTDIGLVYWVCLSSPCVSCYVPFYLGMKAFPESYVGVSEQPSEDEYMQRVDRPFEVDSSSSFWTFTHLRHTVENDYANLAGQIRAKFDIVESESFEGQASVEREAAAVHADDPEQATTILNDFTRSVIAETMTVMRQLETGK